MLNLKYILCIFSWNICFFPGSSQVNNIIFLGGEGNGSIASCYQKVTNHQIYSGGFGDGSEAICHTVTTNHLIFSGGVGDGTNLACMTAITVNQIFTGGNGDGNSTICYHVLSNNGIFTGGNADGSGSICFESISTNSIFSGGNGDGNMANCFTSISGNPIFAGNYGDGYGTGQYLVNAPTLVWHGRYNSNWHFRFNWDQNRIPTINDLVIIRTEKYDPLLKEGWLGVGIQTSNIKEFSRNLYVLSGSSLTLNNVSKATILQDLHIYGSLKSFNIVNEPSFLLLNGANMTVYNQGTMELKSQ